MTQENSDSKNSDYLESMIASTGQIVAKRLAKRKEDVSDTRLRVLAAREYFGYTNSLNAHERNVIALVQRLVINPDNEKQLYELLQQDLRLFRDITNKPSPKRQQELFSMRHDVHTAVTELLTNNGVHRDVLWSLLPAADDGTRLEYLKRYTGIPVDVERISSGFAVIDNDRQEMWEDGSESFNNEQARKSAYVTHKAQESFEGYDNQYVYLRIPRGTSPSEIRDALSGKTLTLFSEGIERTESRRYKVIDDFAEKLFALRLKQQGMSNQAISTRLLKDYGYVKAYSDIDDFIVTLRK